ncbi:uncharacterized protein LOC141902550 [Tubulanus polymorphus]|uniref:uncharacterized protein LOC141902550 n=1 Tax=Tubulanus polymorphus TaxID=672921 RepID=UPI003DA3CAB9
MNYLVLILAATTVVFLDVHGLPSLSDLTNYKSWCGVSNTGMIERDPTGGCCKCSDSEQQCRQCLKPADDLDDACLQHDKCVHCKKTGVPRIHYCECERLIYTRAKKAHCTTASCIAYRMTVILLFGNYPCICEKKFFGFTYSTNLSRNFKTCYD